MHRNVEAGRLVSMETIPAISRFKDLVPVAQCTVAGWKHQEMEDIWCMVHFVNDHPNFKVFKIISITFVSICIDVCIYVLYFAHSSSEVPNPRRKY